MSKILKIVIGFFAISGVLAYLFAGYFIFMYGNYAYKYTGQELLNAINDFRTSYDLQKLHLDQNLCNNLVERWLDIQSPGNGHKGYDKWLADTGVASNSAYGLTAEIFIIKITTPNNAIDKWLQSPGHKIALTKPEFNTACAYAYNGTAVVEFAEKR